MISILTGWGSGLGAGHIQRMALLADYLNTVKNIPARIISRINPDFLPDRLHGYFAPAIQPECRCIIRDMRDSETSEITQLKHHGNVIAIDDCGPGRERADLAVDLLPNLKFDIYSKETFIYGYNFADALKIIRDRSIKKSIDVALYCGYGPAPQQVEQLLAYIPPHLSCAILAGKESLIVHDGKTSPLTASYTETLLSSRALVSHFGISLFEGFIAGCRLVAINPTGYHSRLSDRAAAELGLLNLGVESSLEREHAALVIDSAARQPVAQSVEPGMLLETIHQGLERFIALISEFI